MRPPSRKASTPAASQPYVAFLRGINVGGNKLIKMDDLKQAFSSLGFQNVKTLLASGNVAFETAPADETALAEKISGKLKKAFGFEVGVIIRPTDHLRKLVATNPFKGIKVTPDLRLYVTFLSEKPKTDFKAPYESVGKEFRILKVTDTELCSVLDVAKGGKSTDSMNIIEKQFGRRVTTRNWNTINRLLKD